MQPKLSDNVFLQSLSTRQRTVLLKHHIYSKEDLINFAIKQDLKKLRSNCPNQLSENSLKQLEEFLPKNIPTVHTFYAQFPTRIQNYLKKNNIQSNNELKLFIESQHNQHVSSKNGNSTLHYLSEYLTKKNS